jgi:hypothetical protein
MWQVSPKILCNNHILGEHRELHAIMGTLKKGISIKGYIDNNLVEVQSIIERHKALVQEMTARGYKHHSPIDEEPHTEYLPEEYRTFEVDRESSFNDLYYRCEVCRWRSYLFYYAGYDLLDPFYSDTVVVFMNQNGIYGLRVREDKWEN